MPSLPMPIRSPRSYGVAQPAGAGSCGDKQVGPVAACQHDFRDVAGGGEAAGIEAEELRVFGLRGAAAGSERCRR